MAAPVVVSADRQTVDVGVPVALFTPHLATGGGVNTTGFSSKAQFMVASDGRFLMNIGIDEATSPPFSIVLNWEAALKRR